MFAASDSKKEMTVVKLRYIFKCAVQDLHRGKQFSVSTDLCTLACLILILTGLLQLLLIWPLCAEYVIQDNVPKGTGPTK